MGDSHSTKLQDANIMKHFPKIELHRHLEGMLSIDTLYEFAQRYDLGYSADKEEFYKEVQFPLDAPPDFLLFLSKFKNNWYGSMEDVYTISYNSVKECKDDGLFYLELRFSPEHFALKNNFDRMQVTKTVIEASEKAAKEIDLHIRFLITFNRGKQDQFEMMHLYEQLCALNLSSIVGVDLAGDELGFPPDLFIEFFRYVYTKGIHKSTIHAGEVAPPQQIWTAIDQMHAARIGHGTSCYKDKTLQRVLTARNIPLEQCITSNYQTASWKNEKTHPFGTFYRTGVPVTINSDDPSIQNTLLTDDYVKIAKYFSFDIDDFVACNTLALESSFLDKKSQEIFQKQYIQRVEEFKTKHL